MFANRGGLNENYIKLSYFNKFTADSIRFLQNVIFGSDACDIMNFKIFFSRFGGR